MMDRRAFIGSAAVSAFMLSTHADAQRPKLPRVALVFNNVSIAEMTTHRLNRAFVEGLRELGFVEGRNIVIERRSAEGRYERLPSLLQELIAMQVDAIVATGKAVGVARQETNTIPIVAVGVEGLDAPGGGAASLARPGRNLTGLTSEVELGGLNGKRLQLLKEVAPKTSRVAFLGQSSRSSDSSWHPATEAAANALALTLFWVGADTPEQLDAAFAAIATGRADALLIDGTPVLYVHTRQINEFAARLRLPSVYSFRDGPEAGGLMSYGSNFSDLFRRAATLVGKILKGAKPGELPIEQPTKFELVINLKTATLLGVTIPQSLRVQAELI